jgi:myo-inositol-hexaphosphate 3-phosphohydrolase
MRTVGIIAALAVAVLLLPRLIRWLLDTVAQRRFVQAAPWTPTTQDTCVALLLARTSDDMQRRSQLPASPAAGTAASVPAGTSVVVGVSPSGISVWDRRGRLFDQVSLGKVRGVTLERQAYGFLVLSG